MDIEQEFKKFVEEVELDEIAPWKTGKYKVTDGKTGKVLGRFNSGGKAQKFVDDIFQKGDYESLTVELDEGVEKEASTYRDKEKDDEKKRKFAFGGKKKSRHGASGYGRGEEVEEAVLVNRDYKYDDKKGEIHISKKNFKKVPKDYKNDTPGKETMITYDSKWGTVSVPVKFTEEVEEDYDKNQLMRVQHDERLIAEAGDICGLDKGDLRSKSMQNVWDKKCAPENKDKKSIFGKISKGLDLYNQNSIGEGKMEKLVDTVRKVLVGEGEGDQAEYQKKRKAVAKKFGVESCSALKDEAKRKECYNALDKAHVADHEEQVYLHNMNKKEEVEVKKKVTEGLDLKKLKKEYEDNEDRNNHTGNYLLLAKAFGTSSDVKKVKEIMKRNEKQGSTSKKDMDWMHKNIGPYYDKIRNEEVKVEKTVSKLFSHVRKLMSK